MKKFEIIAKCFTTINMYRTYGLTIEGVCDLIAKQDKFLSQIQESFDDQKTARNIFDEKYRPQAISHRVEDFRTMLVEIVFFELSEAEYDENGKLISERKLLDRAVEALPADDQEKNSYEKVGYWKGNMDLTRFKIEKRYEWLWRRNERSSRFRRDEEVQIPLIKFTDRHKKDLYGRVFALYGYIEYQHMRFYRFCWEVNPDNLNEAIDENKIFILYPFHKPTYGCDNGVMWDGETAEPVDFDVYGPNSEFVVYVAEFDVPDTFDKRYTTEDEIEWVFDHHPSPTIKEEGRFMTPQEANDARYNIMKNLDEFDHERRDNRVYFRACYIQEENERGKRRLSFSAPTLYNWDK